MEAKVELNEKIHKFQQDVDETKLSAEQSKALLIDCQMLFKLAEEKVHKMDDQMREMINENAEFKQNILDEFSRQKEDCHSNTLETKRVLN